MCRMLLIDKKGIEHVENNSGGLVKLLRHLVISGGGHHPDCVRGRDPGRA